MFRKITNSEIAKKLFLDEIKPILETEIISIDDADERVIAEDIISDVNLPHYRRAAMDGFAVKSKDTLGASRNSPVILTLSDYIDDGKCVPARTGLCVPDKADAVVMIEDTEVYSEYIEVFSQVHPFENIGEIGEDVKKGDLVIKKGKKLNPADISLLASINVEKIRVFKRPVVAIIPTGDEIVPRGTIPLKIGNIYETNGLMASLYVRKFGGIPRLLDIVRDDMDKIKDAIYSNSDADMIIMIAGTSVGERDYVPECIKEIGKLLVHGVSISPGKPTALGIVNDKPVLCMPGYPVAGLVALLWFGKAAILKLGNLLKFENTYKAKLSEKIASKIGYRTFSRVKIENGYAIPIATSGSGLLSSVSKSDGFVIIPENVEGYDKGKIVDVVLID